MKKALWISIVVVGLLAMTVAPAAAGGDNNQRRWQGNVFGLVGEVTAVDAGTGTITVLVRAGNRLVKDYIGEELTVETDDDTLFLIYGDPKCTIGDFTDVAVGADVSMNGLVDEDGTFLARRVTIGVPCPCTC